MIAWLFVFLMFFALPSVANATVINAASCSKADVDTAVSSASSGDTVQLPGCTVTWASGVAIASKSISFKGVGAGTSAQCGADGSQTTYTCIKRAASGTWTGGSTPTLLYTTIATGHTPAGYSEIAYITWIPTATPTGCARNYPANVTLLGDSRKIHIHHNVFYAKNPCDGLLVRNNNVGLVEQNTFYTTDNSAVAANAGHNTWLGVGANGDNSWAQADTLGTEDVVMFERNTYICDTGCTLGAWSDYGYGVRVTERFNTYGHGSSHSHGTESGGRGWRGPRHRENYENIMTMIAVAASVIDSRGVGTFRIFNNTLTGSAPNNFLDFNTYRADSGQPESAFYPWAYCGQRSVTLTRSGTTATGTTTDAHGIGTGTPPRAYIDITGAGAPFDGTGIQATGTGTFTFTYTVDPSGATSSSGTQQASYDGNTDSTGYPCLDQVGRGQGTYLSGDPFTTQSPVGSLNQELKPAYMWNNTVNGTLDDGQCSAGCTVVVEDREYFNENASYNGTAGMGRGARGSRPLTPTLLNTAWWATDQGGDWNTLNGSANDGCLDVWNGTSWDDCDYTPTPYPHSLSTGGGGGGEGTPPRFAPSINLRRADGGALAMVGRD